MSKYPEKSELNNYQILLPKIAQKGPFWCIPASIENMLNYVGINDITQEELVLNYCRKYGNDSLITKQNNEYRNVNVDALDDDELIQVAKISALRHANFGTLKEAVEESSKFDYNKYELSYTDNISDPTVYIDLIKTSISSQEPVLIASTNPNGSSHIRVVVAYDNVNLVLYDPALDEILKVQTNTIKFNPDMLVLKKK